MGLSLTNCDPVSHTCFCRSIPPSLQKCVDVLEALDFPQEGEPIPVYTSLTEICNAAGVAVSSMMRYSRHPEWERRRMKDHKGMAVRQGYYVYSSAEIIEALKAGEEQELNS